MTEVFVPVRIEVMPLGEAWLGIAAAILKGGVEGSWDGQPIVEVFRATIDVHAPKADDSIIAQHGDPERLAWMHTNFTTTPEWRNSVTPTATRRACTTTPTRVATRSGG